MSENIYKGLECHCNEFERIPIDRRNFGMAGVATSYTLSISENLADYKLSKFLETQGGLSGCKNFIHY